MNKTAAAAATADDCPGVPVIIRFIIFTVVSRAGPQAAHDNPVSHPVGIPVSAVHQFDDDR